MPKRLEEPARAAPFRRKRQCAGGSAAPVQATREPEEMLVAWA